MNFLMELSYSPAMTTQTRSRADFCPCLTEPKIGQNLNWVSFGPKSTLGQIQVLTTSEFDRSIRKLIVHESLLVHSFLYFGNNFISVPVLFKKGNIYKYFRVTLETDGGAFKVELWFNAINFFYWVLSQSSLNRNPKISYTYSRT